MSAKLYTIGDFAAINKISTRMLRHYDKIELLKPATVAENGYRMYSSDAIPVIALIKKYRSCAFSLEEIGLLLDHNGNIQQLTQRKIHELQQQETANAMALGRLYELSNTEGNVPFDNFYEISLSYKNSQLLLCDKDFCMEAQIERAFDKLYDFLTTMELNPTGLSMLLTELSSGQGYKGAIPVKQRCHTTTYDFAELEAGQYLSTFHYGDYCEIGLAYDRLIQYAEQNALKCSTPFLERYFLDSSHTIHSTEYITEISIKITP